MSSPSLKFPKSAVSALALAAALGFAFPAMAHVPQAAASVAGPPPTTGLG